MQERYYRRVLREVETYAYDLEPGHFMDVWVTSRGKVSWAGHWDGFEPARAQAVSSGERDKQRAAFVLECDDEGTLKLWRVGYLVRLPRSSKWQTLKSPQLVCTVPAFKVVPGARSRPSVLAERLA